MCGRFEVAIEPSATEILAIIEELNRPSTSTSGSLAVQTGEVCPTHMAAILMEDSGQVRPAAMRWGFPRWNGGGVIINARSETVKQRPLFQDAYRLRRIAVPTSGFYEWRHDESGRQKEKFLFQMEGQGTHPLYLAGIYSSFPTQDGDLEPRFVILTTNANASIAPYHDRMPVLLTADELSRWMLDDDYADALLRRTPSPLTATPADAHVQTSLL